MHAALVRAGWMDGHHTASSATPLRVASSSSFDFVLWGFMPSASISLAVGETPAGAGGPFDYAKSRLFRYISFHRKETS